MSNHLDEAIKHLKAGLRQIEQDERELKRAKKRLEKALQAFGDGTSPIAKRNLGPRNYASRDIVYDKAAAMPQPFTIEQLAAQLPELRHGQVKGAVNVLYRMDVLRREARGLYSLKVLTEGK